MLSDGGMVDLDRRASWPIDFVQEALYELLSAGHYFENERPRGFLVRWGT